MISESDHKMRHTAVSMVSSCSFSTADGSRYSTDQLKQLPKHPCSILFGIIHSMETKSQNLILAQFEEQKIFWESVKEALWLSYLCQDKYTTTTGTNADTDKEHNVLERGWRTFKWIHIDAYTIATFKHQSPNTHSPLFF